MSRFVGTGKACLLATLFVSIPLACGLAHTRHPIHISVTEIEYDATEKELEIMMRIFVDDLENALRLYHKQAGLDILDTDEAAAKKLIGAYVLDHFEVVLDNRKTRMEYLGQEVEGQAFVCYILAPGIQNWTTCQVTNRILFELFDDQSNIVHVTSGGVTRSRRLMADNAAGIFSFAPGN
ncbi:MAG TPA: DUF6702 family protein [Cyclobacteriaceae bacterium]|nr:DUF6702 family protein [Cyclobacteriaceae bacterium]